MKITKRKLIKLIKESFQYYGPAGRSKEQLGKDRAFKKEWNKNADHKFFNDQVIKIHWIGAFGGALSQVAAVMGADKNQTSAVLKDIMKRNDINNKINKYEMSCVGYLKPPFQDEAGATAPYGLLIKGYVSYASSTDAQTEWSSTATKDDIEKYSGSGLPKRPLIKSGAMYGAADFVEPHEAPQGYNELIVDNWQTVAVIVNLQAKWWKSLQPRYAESRRYRKIIPLRKNEIKNIVKFCNSNGVNVVDQNLRPISL